MNNFEKAINFIFDSEGEYCNDKADPGGETKWGIDTKSHPGIDKKSLSKEQAESIYYHDYWLPINAEKIKWPLCLYYFDMAINQGPGIAKKTLQKSIGVDPDGIIGPVTVAAANKATDSQMTAFMTSRMQRYVLTNNFLTFGNGWINRLFNCVKFGERNNDG